MLITKITIFLCSHWSGFLALTFKNGTFIPPETNICSTTVTSDKSWLRGISQTPVCKMGQNDIFHSCGKLMEHSHCINTKSNSKKSQVKFT